MTHPSKNGFDQYRSAKRQRSGRCSVCGGPAEGRVVVVLQERKLNPEKTAKDANRMSYPSIASTSGTFCEEHAVAIFEQASKAVRE